MSIIVSGISYRHSGCQPLFENITFSVPAGAKVSLIGPNGAGKSTLLQILAGRLTPAAGSVAVSSTPYYIPQHTAPDRRSVASLLGAEDKLQALREVCAGSADPACFDTLNDDWQIEDRCRAALSDWGLGNISLDAAAATLSGGERTKVRLAGLSLLNPDIVLLDEPTNHLDGRSRAKLYELIQKTHATLVAVSHDIALLNMLHTTCYLTASGIRLYGGNYDLYREHRSIEQQALADRIEAEQTALRMARKRAQEVRERQERRAAQGKRSRSKGGQARILVNSRGAQAQNSASRLSDRHADIVDERQQRLADLRERQIRCDKMKIDFDDASLHTDKRLILSEGMNFCFTAGAPLWPQPIDLEIRSGERIRIAGDSGSGKTTFVRLLLGDLTPSAGSVERADVSVAYIDQEYSALDTPLSVALMAERYNMRRLSDHEIKTRLDRALFTRETWDKPCCALSGGERMRLMLCCLMIADHTPDMFVLDEPTNNLDIDSIAILTDTIRSYRGTLLVISHDESFVDEIGVTRTIELT